MIIDTNEMKHWELTADEIDIIKKALLLISREQLKDAEHQMEIDINNVEYRFQRNQDHSLDGINGPVGMSMIGGRNGKENI